MAELGLADSAAARAGGGFRGAGRDFSPDSVICTLESNYSLFSSASASVDRCSFTSDAQDRDSLTSDFPQHLAGHESGGREGLSGRDLDQTDLSKVTALRNRYLSKKAGKAKVRKREDNKVLIDVDDEAPPSLDSASARNSFSLALKECQERRSRSEALANTLEQRRPVSLDLNITVANVVSSSPRLGVMKKTTVSTQKSANFPSPGTPNYRHMNGGADKGWSSERVPLQGGANRRKVGTTLLTLNNGRTLPSKWEDAERWILSPVAGDGFARSSYQQQQRRPKSKSGPLGPPGVAYYSMYSPGISMYDERNVNNIIAASPFSAGVMMPAALSAHTGGNNANFQSMGEQCIARSASVHGFSDLVCQSSGTSSRDEKAEDAKDAAANVCRTVSRRDMATQMSPESSSHSSSRRRSSCSVSTPSILPATEVKTSSSAKQEVKDVQIDERVTVSRWSKKHKSRTSDAGDGKLDSSETQSSTWEISDAPKSLAEIKREEAKITAWENLQKAKAEAAIRKLEMKLEKKRSTSMDRIMKKLKSAQRKAQEMRNTMQPNQANQSSKPSLKAVTLRKTKKMATLGRCFTCHAS